MTTHPTPETPLPSETGVFGGNGDHDQTKAEGLVVETHDSRFARKLGSEQIRSDEKVGPNSIAIVSANRSLLDKRKYCLGSVQGIRRLELRIV
jgi:hypothetical protein